MSTVTNTATDTALQVLVVDDNPDIPTMFAAVIARRGWQATVAHSGEEALRLLPTRPFDLVVTDLQMGAVGGLEVMTAVRESLGDIPVILMTGYASLDSALSAMRAGACDYITKPFTLDEIDILLSQVADRIALRRENRSLVGELADAYRRINKLQVQMTLLDGQSSASEEQRKAPATPSVPTGLADSGTTPTQAGIAAYQAISWPQQRSLERLQALLQSGTLSPAEFEQLTALIPEEFPVA